jgi:PfaD family protein
MSQAQPSALQPGALREASESRQAPASANVIAPEQLGNPQFRSAHGIRLNYLAGAMYKGIASVDLVVALGRAGLLGFFGAGGLGLEVLDEAIGAIQRALPRGQAFGMNLLASPGDPGLERDTVELYLRRDIRRVEASAYVQMSPSLVRYRLAGLSRRSDGGVIQGHHVIAKVSRGEVGEAFMRPAPRPLVEELRRQGLVTSEQAELARRVPVAQDVCVEADSAGHTDRGNACVLLPAMRSLRDRIVREEGYRDGICVGSAGGIGTPEAALAAFMLGAEFILTGSINQCTPEAGTSDAVKDILQDLGVSDTDYAPAGDMFEIGAKIQVVRKGLLFSARARKLYELYLRHDSLDELDGATRTTIQDRYFRRSFESVWDETRAYLARHAPERVTEVERSPKRKMALIFRWYFVHTTRLALAGAAEQRADYQIHCGPALGAFNGWVKGTAFETWRQRRVDAIGEHLMRETAALLTRTLSSYGGAGPVSVSGAANHGRNASD